MSLITIYFLRFSNGIMSVFRNGFILGRYKSKLGWYLHLLSWFCRRIDWSFLEWSVMISAVYLQVVQGEKKCTLTGSHTDVKQMQQILNKYWLLVEGIWVLLCYSLNSFVCWKKCTLKSWERVGFFFNWQGYYKIKAQRTEHSIIVLKKKKKKHLSQGSPTMHNGTKETIS